MMRFGNDPFVGGTRPTQIISMGTSEKGSGRWLEIPLDIKMSIKSFLSLKNSTLLL
jgi:hypothetical protein